MNSFDNFSLEGRCVQAGSYLTQLPTLQRNYAPRILNSILSLLGGHGNSYRKDEQMSLSGQLEEEVPINIQKLALDGLRRKPWAREKSMWDYRSSAISMVDTTDLIKLRQRLHSWIISLVQTILMIQCKKWDTGRLLIILGCYNESLKSMNTWFSLQCIQFWLREIWLIKKQKKNKKTRK